MDCTYFKKTDDLTKECFLEGTFSECIRTLCKDVKCPIQNKQRLHQIYFSFCMDMTDEYDSDKVWNEVIQEKFAPCGNCGEPNFLTGEKHPKCAFCGEYIFDEDVEEMNGTGLIIKGGSK